MKTTNKMKCKRIRNSIYLIVISMLMLPPSVLSARGKHANVDHSKDSNIVIVGDSRIFQLSQVVKRSLSTKERASLNAVYGGHYAYKEHFFLGELFNTPQLITYPSYLQEQKQLIRKCLREHGSCVVVIEATVNDTGGLFPGLESESVNKIASLKQEYHRIKDTYTVTYAPKVKTETKRWIISNNKKKKIKKSWTKTKRTTKTTQDKKTNTKTKIVKTIKVRQGIIRLSKKSWLQIRKTTSIEKKTQTVQISPEVYVTSVIPPRSDEQRVKSINDRLKRRFGDDYIYLGTSYEWAPYYKDELHFNEAGSALLFQLIKDAVKRKEPY